MPALKLEQFGGMLPAWDGHLLPTGQSSFAKNGFLFGGNLIGWRKPKLLRTLLNSAARMAYRVPTVSQTQARALLVLKAQPLDGDTVFIGDLTYTFRTMLVVQEFTAVVGLPFEVVIGADVAATATHLAQAITADSGQNTNAGVTYGENTPLNTDVKYVLPDTDPPLGQTVPQVVNDLIGPTLSTYLLVGATDFGAAFNLISVGESTGAVRMVWLFDTLSFSDTTTTFRGGTNPTFDTSITGPAVWLEFNDPDTNVVRSPVIDDQFNRYYFASPSQMPEYTTYDRIQQGEAPWLLGIPAPGCAVELDVTGGGNNLTLGNFTASGGIVLGKANRTYVMKITTPGATQIEDVQVFLAGLSTPSGGFPNANFVAVVYNDLNGAPDTLINTGKITTGLNADAGNVSAFVNPTNLNGNTDYWIGIMVDTPLPFEGGPVGGGLMTISWPSVFTNGPVLTAPIGELAHSQVTSDGINVADGDVLTLGLSTYRFKNTITAGTASAVDVHIGANAAATLVNLEHAINGAGGTIGTDYSINAAPNFFMFASAPSGLAVPLTVRSASYGDGSNIQTTFVPVGSPPHLTLPDITMQNGYATAQFGMQMYADFLTSDIIEARSYVYTWVSTYGEEGPPSPPTLLNGWSNGTWFMRLWQPPPNDLGILRTLKSINIYRTVPGNGGATVFFFVKNVPLGTASFTDTIPNNTVALNNQLQSTNWFPPPENLQGLTVMQNGMIAGFIGNAVWFCEPYHPHAWPPANVLTVDYPIVGMGVTNGALVVCTSAQPYVMNGSAPTSMTQMKCADANPCSSRASILGGDGAVSYISPNGLIQVTAAGVATNTTDLWITREKWQQLVPQKYARAIALASSYYCLGSVSPDGTDHSLAQQGFTIELAQDNTSFTIWPQPGGHRLGLEILDAPVDGQDTLNVLTDPWTGIGIVIANGGVYYFDFTDKTPVLKTYTWRSKLYQQNAKRNFTCMKVYFTVPPGTPALNPTRLGQVASDPVWTTLAADRWAYLKTYVDLNNDGSLTLIDAREIRNSGEVLRIIDGFKCDTWQWQIEGRVNISNVQIATTIKELAQV